MTPEEAPEEEPQWPDTLKFWLLVTFAVIAVPSALCGGAVWLARRLFF